jgi:hypothetical protein
VAEACSVAGELLNCPVKEAVEMSAFAGNQVFRIQCDTLVSFLKLADGPDLRREVGVLRVLGQVGIPVPFIEAADPSGDLAGIPCVLLRQVGGDPVDCATPEFSLAGRPLRQVHEVMLDGYGFLVASSEGHFRNASGGHLLHGDFNPRHVYAHGGRLTGIIDWGDAICGDPIYDLGRVLHSAVLDKGDIKYGLDVVSRLLETYGDAPWRQGDLTDSLLVYAAVFIIWSMRGELSGGSPWPPWWPIQSKALSKMVDALWREGGSLKQGRDDRFDVLGSDARHRGGHVLVG